MPDAAAVTVADAPQELQDAIREFWPPAEWDNAARISLLESGWDAFALNDTTSSQTPCGTVLRSDSGTLITAEKSLGWFQINACNFPDWNPCHFYNTRHNVGTAHLLWDNAGQTWRPWFFSARELGLLP